jgi:TRAP-type mannitol/chloroaromatic compound transport system permease large subunit
MPPALAFDYKRILKDLVERLEGKVSYTPIAFSLILVTLVLMYFMGSISPLIIAQSVMRGIDNFPLLAIPFFILAGDLMNVGGISKRIVEFSRAILGHVRGGLGYVAVVACMIFAGVSGSAAADD